MVEGKKRGATWSEPGQTHIFTRNTTFCTMNGAASSNHMHRMVFPSLQATKHTCSLETPYFAPHMSQESCETETDREKHRNDNRNEVSEESDTGSDGSDTGSDVSDTGSDNGSDGSDTGSDGSDTGSDGSDTGSDTGSDGSDTGSDGSDTGSDGSDTGSDGSDTGSDTGSDGSDTGSDTGNDGSDKGSDGSDKGNDGSDKGSDGSDKGSDTRNNKTHAQHKPPPPLGHLCLFFGLRSPEGSQTCFCDQFSGFKPESAAHMVQRSAWQCLEGLTQLPPCFALQKLNSGGAWRASLS